MTIFELFIATLQVLSQSPEFKASMTKIECSQRFFTIHFYGLSLHVQQLGDAIYTCPSWASTSRPIENFEGWLADLSKFRFPTPAAVA
jgi:hypothetical protein